MKQELNREAIELARAFRHTFESPDGKKVLAYLTREYLETPIPTMPTSAMAEAVGKHNLMMDIKTILERGIEDE